MAADFHHHLAQHVHLRRDAKAGRFAGGHAALFALRCAVGGGDGDVAVEVRRGEKKFRWRALREMGDGGAFGERKTSGSSSQKIDRMSRRNLIFARAIFPSLVTLFAAACFAAEFAATGPTKETKLDAARFHGAVKVTFDLQPTTMSFDLPWHFCSVAENGLKFAHVAAETYDPRRWDGKGANASFEPGMDKEGRFARVWIEHQSPARIVVRVRYALNNSD